MEPTIIASGFPRAGTTTLMRMLEGGGFKVLAGKKTKVAKDEYHPYGYYEMNNVGKFLKASKPKVTAGKVIKVVAPYVHYLPGNRPLRVIFMLRDETEIISSLLAMKTIWNHRPSKTVAIARQYLEERKIPTKYIQYNDMVKYPKTTALMISDFLGKELDVDLMAKAVDPEARKKVRGVRIKGQEKLLRFDLEVIAGD